MGTPARQGKKRKTATPVKNAPSSTRKGYIFFGIIIIYYTYISSKGV
jgi:hypothetical protein